MLKIRLTSSKRNLLHFGEDHTSSDPEANEEFYSSQSFLWLAYFVSREIAL